MYPGVRRFFFPGERGAGRTVPAAKPPERCGGRSPPRRRARRGTPCAPPFVYGASIVSGGLHAAPGSKRADCRAARIPHNAVQINKISFTDIPLKRGNMHKMSFNRGLFGTGGSSYPYSVQNGISERKNVHIFLHLPVFRFYLAVYANHRLFRCWSTALLCRSFVYVQKK